MNGAGMMAELNPVPLAAMPLTVERAQASDGADGVEAGFSRLSAFVTTRNGTRHTMNVVNWVLGN